MRDVRDTVPTGWTTRRDMAVAWCKEQLEAALYIADEMPSDDNPKLFELVDFGTLEDIAPRFTPGCMLQQGDEDINEGMYNKSTKTFRLYVHFKIVNIQGLDQQGLITYYFGRIIQTLVMPEDFAGNVIMDITEVGNSIIANGPTDPEPGGTIFFDIEYRHAYGNPFAE